MFNASESYFHFLIGIHSFIKNSPLSNIFRVEIVKLNNNSLLQLHCCLFIYKVPLTGLLLFSCGSFKTYILIIVIELPIVNQRKKGLIFTYFVEIFSTVPTTFELNIMF